jgi:hypothetical protein
MRRRHVFVLVAVIALALVVGAVPLWGYVRESRADGLAVKYGAAPSKGKATLADRCTGVMRDGYNRTDDPRTAMIGPKTWAFIAPKVCALGVGRGLVADDGTMTEKAGYDLMLAVTNRMGMGRFQTLMFNELAVGPYHLAKAGHVTRLHRCLAMSYSAYDGLPPGGDLPTRDVWQRISRKVCTTAIKRGIIPESGAPISDSDAGRELQRLMFLTTAELTQ